MFHASKTWRTPPMTVLFVTILNIATRLERQACLDVIVLNDVFGGTRKNCKLKIQACAFSRARKSLSSVKHHVHVII